MSFSSPCPEWAKKLAARTQADLSREERAALNAHLLYCQKCVATAASYSRMQQAIRSLPPVKPLADLPHLSFQQTRISSHAFKEPERISNITDLADRQTRQQRKRPNQLRPWVSLVAAAAIALIIGATTFVFSNARSTGLGSNSNPTQPKLPTQKPDNQARSVQSVFSGCALFNQHNDDAGMQYICGQNLYKDINLEQVKGNYRVVLYQAYADTNQIVIAYQVEVKQTDGNYAPVSSQPHDTSSGRGTEYGSSLSIQGGVPLPSGNSAGTAEVGYVITSFHTPVDQKATDELKLRMQTHISEIEYKPAPNEPGNNGKVKSTTNVTIDFAVPYHPEKKIFTVNQTSTSGGGNLTLETITASLSAVNIQVSVNGAIDHNAVLQLQMSSGNISCDGGEGSYIPTIGSSTMMLSCPILTQPSWQVHGFAYVVGPKSTPPPLANTKYDWNFMVNIP